MTEYASCRVRCRGLIVHDEALLIVKNSRGSDYYALPGGHLDPGESPDECIKREIFEELGVTAELGRLLFIYSFVNKDGQQCVEFLFEITNGEAFREHEKYEATHAHELSEIRWMGKNDDCNLLPKEVRQYFQNGTLFSDTVRFVKG